MNTENETMRTGQGKFTGRHMLAIMIAFFGVIIAVNITMAWFASNSWTGLVVKNSYVASQHFNDELAAAREQHGRGWKSEIGFESNRLSLKLVDENDSPVVLDELKVVAGRPATEINDQTIGFDYVGGGLWIAEANLGHGLWKLDITGNKDNAPFRLDARMYVSQSGQGRLQ
ncbi:MAG: FixH family protein [Rhizobiaceae bacterium]